MTPSTTKKQPFEKKVNDIVTLIIGLWTLLLVGAFVFHKHILLSITQCYDLFYKVIDLSWELWHSLYQSSLLQGQGLKIVLGLIFVCKVPHSDHFVRCLSLMLCFCYKYSTTCLPWNTTSSYYWHWESVDYLIRESESGHYSCVCLNHDY